MAEILDFEMLQGDTFKWDITVTDTDGSIFDLTGFNVRGMMRERYTDTNPAETFACSVTSIPNGTVRVSLTAAETAALSKGLYYYDIEIYTSDVVPEVYKIYRGRISVLPEATKGT